MNLIEACVTSPVKVAVGVILVTLFGVLSILSMPVQLTPEPGRIHRFDKDGKTIGP